MSRSQLMRVHPDFKQLVDEMRKEHELSSRLVTKNFVSLIKKSKKKPKRIFEL